MDDYRDKVKSIRFSTCGMRSNIATTIKRNGSNIDGNVYSCWGYDLERDEELLDKKDFNVSEDDWYFLIQKLFCDFDVLSWKKEYYRPLLDGLQWELEIELENDTLSYKGSNGFPPHWEELVSIFTVFEKLLD